jgi:hypothetical protein
MVKRDRALPDACSMQPWCRTRAIGALLAIGVVLVACGGEETPAGYPTTSGEPSGAHTVAVSCEAGNAHVSAPVVIASEDGVHIQTGALGSSTIRLERDGEPTIYLLDGRSRARRFQIAPDTYVLICEGDGSATAASSTSLRVADPAGRYRDPSTTCGCSCAWVGAPPAADWDRAPARSIRAWLRIRPTDRIEPRGYVALTTHPDRDEAAWYVITRGARVVARMWLVAGQSTADIRSCADIAPRTSEPSW